MSFKLSPPVPPNIPEDKVYSINDFNNYFDQLQRIISTHDDSLSTVISAMANYFPFSMNPETINMNLANGIYYITEQVNGTFPFENVGNSCFLISISNGSSSTQFLFDYSGIYSRRNPLSPWNKISGASVIDSLVSTSTIDSLSANQGRLLNEGKLDIFSHLSSDTEITNINYLSQGIHVFINANIEGTFPEFCDIRSGNNNCVIEVFGIQDQTYCQVVTDNWLNVRGFRSGTYENEGIWWLDWQQIATTENIDQLVNEALENLVIDGGEF